MSINNKTFFGPATNGDVAGVAIALSISLGHIATALEKIDQAGLSSDEIKDLRTQSDKLSAMFDVLTGWTP